MLPTQLDQSVTVGTKLWPWGLLRTSRALRGPLGPQKGLFGPLGVLIWPQGGPKWHVIMCYTCGEWFKVIWGLSWQYLVRSSFYPSWHVSRTKNLNFGAVKIFHEYMRRNLFHHNNWSKNNILCQFQPNRRVCFFQKMAICPYPFLAIFDQFWHFLARFWPLEPKMYQIGPFGC